MASDNRSPTESPRNVDTGSYLSAEQAGLRSSLRSRFTAGNVITANDINNLRTLFNAFSRHYHNYSDYGAIATYGNNGPRTQGPVSRNTDTGTSGYGDPGGVGSGSTITAGTINGFVNAVNALRSHNHSIEDYYY